MVGFLALLTAGVAVKVLRDGTTVKHSAQLSETFARWKVQNGKLYASPSENDFRMKVFAEQLSFIEETNAKYNAKMAAKGEKLSDPMFEMNMFGDLTNEEFTVMHTGDAPVTEEYVVQTPIDAEPMEFPEQSPSTSLGQTPFMPTIRNQGACGSCWAFSAIVEFERLVYEQKKQKIDLSQQELVDCVIECGGCQGGSSENAYNYMTRKGIHASSAYPYIAAKSNCRNTLPNPIKVTGTGISRYALFSSDRAAKAVSQGVLATISVYSNGAFRYLSKTDDVFDATGNQDCNMKTGHAIVLTKYNSKTREGTVLNSWSSSWGNKGYKRIKGCSHSSFFGSTGRFVYPYAW